MPMTFEIRDPNGVVVNTIIASDQGAADSIAAANGPTHTAVLVDDGVEKAVRHWRQKARAYRLAFRQALMMVPDSTGQTTLLAKLDAAAAAEGDPYGALTMMLDNVTIYERWRPEIDALAIVLLVTVEGYSEAEADTLIDRLFGAAIALDAGNQDRAAAILAGTEDFL